MKKTNEPIEQTMDKVRAILNNEKAIQRLFDVVISLTERIEELEKKG